MCAGCHLKSLRDNIGIVQQDVYLFAGTVYDNIAYGRPGADADAVIEAAKMQMRMSLLWSCRRGMTLISGSVA